MEESGSFKTDIASLRSSSTDLFNEALIHRERVFYKRAYFLFTDNNNYIHNVPIYLWKTVVLCANH